MASSLVEIHLDLAPPGHKHAVFATISEALADNMPVCTSPLKTVNAAGLKASNSIIPNNEVRMRFTTQAQRNGFYDEGLLFGE